MDALQHIQAHAKIETLLEYYSFDKINDEGNMLRACCKMHKGDNPSAFVANMETNMWFCHGACGVGGDMAELVMQMEGLRFPQAVKKLADIFDMDISTLELTRVRSNTFKSAKDFMKATNQEKYIPEEFTYTTGNNVKSYRGFKHETLQHFQLTFVNKYIAHKKDGSTYELHDRLAIPIYFNSTIVGVSFRATKSNHFPKWSHQPMHISTKHMLYNFSNKTYQEKIILVEGMFDVWAFHEVGLHASCTYGSHLTPEQLRLLIEAGVEEVTLAYDGDEAGCVATQKAINMLRNKVKLYVIYFAQDEDAENITRERLLQYYKERKLIV